jgi:DNA-binding NarL/FixJ family response regulator
MHPTADQVGPRVLVVDDDDRTRALVVHLLERAGFEIVESDRGQEALRLAADNPPQLALLDVQMPGISGYEVCAELRRRFGDRIAIMFLSGTRIEAFDRVAGFKFGADDYVVKPFDPEELIARVRALVQRTTPRSNGGARSILTQRELQVLELLGQGTPSTAIANQLFISPKTVAKHIERILHKLDVHSRSEAVALAFREGIVR